ncbi:MAG TPA: L-seryl-tRNA(Sec) selenium transferase, partial [Chthoniobacterales bacterium]
MSTTALRAIPSVDKVVQSLGAADLPHPIVVALIRRELSALRKGERVPEFAAIVERIRTALDDLRLTRIQPVINGTGVIIHTNLGRAPLAAAAGDSLAAIARGYSNLELDLVSGARGKRGTYLEHCLALACRAEAATVVNNCAAALVLILRHFTKSKPEVIISRGELVQIGGGFRIPEILEASGARLREVGTTNRTNVDDYACAIGGETGLILKVHRSNFFMGGFVESPPTAALAQLARKKRIPFVED